MKSLAANLSSIFLMIISINCQEKVNHTETGSRLEVKTESTSESFLLEINNTVVPIVIDGKLSEPIWSEARQISLVNNANGEIISDANYHTTVQACYDSENLYIAFVNRDKNIYTRYTIKDEFLWQDEVVEVFIDGDPDISTYIELEVSPTNVVFDSYITDTANIDLVETPKFEIEGLQTAVQVIGTVNDSTDVDQSWTVEILIPLETVTQMRSDGKKQLNDYRMNFYRINRDSQGPSYYAWSPTHQRFHAPSNFGSLTLK